nr:putative nuclease HARBI1 [Onthophagus taurus]
MESERYFRQNGFPMVIGAMDGSHIKIDKPSEDSDSYINRKGYYSIQMQAVCNHNRKIIDLFVGYPGSVHDSRVVRNSSLFNTLEEKCGNYFILADSGYPLKSNVLTPFKDRGNLTDRQQNYNRKLSKNRYVIDIALDY